MKNTSDATAPFAAANGSELVPTDQQIVMGFEALRICLGRPTRVHKPQTVISWMAARLPCEHVWEWTGRPPDGAGDTCVRCGAKRDRIVSAPSVADLMPTPEEQEHFRRLLEWQEASARSQMRLGETQNDKVQGTAD